MGRATITGGGPTGLYTVAVDYGSDRLQAMIDKLNALLVELNAQLVAAQAELDAAINSTAEQELADAVELAVLAYEIKLAENCTLEGWDASPIRVSFEAYDAARKAYYDHLDLIARLKQDLAKPTEDKANAEIQLPILDHLIGRAESTLETAQNLLDDATDCVNACAVSESWRPDMKLKQDDLSGGWAGWVHPKWGGWKTA